MDQVETVEVVLQVILTPIFALLVETEGLQSLFKRVNQALKIQDFRLSCPPQLASTLKSNFERRFQDLRRELHTILKIQKVESWTKLSQIEPSFNEIVHGPQPSCLGALIFTQKVNTKITSKLVDLCDECSKPLDPISIMIVSIPSTCKIEALESNFEGVLTFMLVLEGSNLGTLKVGSRSQSLMTMSSVLFEPSLKVEVDNRGPKEILLLKIDFFRLFQQGLNGLNLASVQVASESNEIQHICNLVQLESEN